MMTKKHGITLALLVVFSSLLFAQTSKTNESTRGLFGTDVDNFMDVNGWQNVQPENMFGFVGVGGTYGTNIYDLGFAKQFGNIFWGSYFSGDFGDWSKTTSTTGDTKTVTGKAANSDSTSFDFYNLIGIGNLGLKFRLYYFDYSSMENEDYKYDAYDLIFSIDAGMNVSAGSVKLSPYGRVSYNLNPNKYSYKQDYTDVDNGVDYAKGDWRDSGSSYLYWRLGSGIDLGQKGIVGNSFDVFFSSYIYFYPEELSNIGGVVTRRANHKSAFDLYFVPSYTLTVTPMDKLSFKVKAKLSVHYNTGKRGEDPQVVTNSFYLTPDVDAGIVFKASDKFQLNGGIAVDVPYIWFSGTESGDTKTGTWRGSGTTPDVTFYTGFVYSPVKNISFDCAWNVVESVVDCFKTDWSQASTEDAFFGNLNKILFTNLSFLVSVKF